MANNNPSAYQNSIKILETALPYMTTPARRSMQLIIKASELMDTLHGVNIEPDLSACNLNEDSDNMEVMLTSVKDLLPNPDQEMVDMMLNFIKARRLYATYRSFMDSTPSSPNKSSNSGMGNMIDFLMSQLTPEQKENFETMSIMLNALN